MTSAATRHITTTIACPLATAYAFLSDPANLPRWASGLGTLRQSDGRWQAETPDGVIGLRFCPINPYGVLDHWVTLPDGSELYMPMRVVAHGDGCELTLTLFRQPTMDDARFAADAAWVQRDLDRTGELLAALCIQP